MSSNTSPIARIWNTIRNFFAALTGPDKAADDRSRRVGEMHPRQEQQGRTFQGGLGG